MFGVIINGIMLVFIGKFYDKYGFRLLIYIGFIILIIIIIMLCFLYIDIFYMYLIVVYVIRMFLVFLFMMLINIIGINFLRNEEILYGMVIMNFGCVMVGLLGIVLMVILMSFGVKIFLFILLLYLIVIEIK